MKILFISLLKLFSFSRYYVSVKQQKSLIRKIRLMSQIRERSGKCGQLIEYNTRNIFLAKSCTESGGETSPRHFPEKLKLKFNIVCFNGMPSCQLLKYIETNLQAACFYLIFSFSNKQNEVWGQSPCLNSCITFENFFFSHCVLLTDQIWLCKILSNVSIPIVCQPGCDVMNFEVNFFFLIHDHKVKTKI